VRTTNFSPSTSPIFGAEGLDRTERLVHRIGVVTHHFTASVLAILKQQAGDQRLADAALALQAEVDRAPGGAVTS
jgi:hypothetical protein